MWKNYLKDESRARYKTYTQTRNKLRKSTGAAAIRRDIEVSLKAKKNPEQFWNHIKRRLRSKEAKPNLQKPDGTLAVNDKERGEALLDFFFTIDLNDESLEPAATPVSTFANDINFLVEKK